MAHCIILSNTYNLELIPFSEVFVSLRAALVSAFLLLISVGCGKDTPVAPAPASPTTPAAIDTKPKEAIERPIEAAAAAPAPAPAPASPLALKPKTSSVAEWITVLLDMKKEEGKALYYGKELLAEAKILHEKPYDTEAFTEYFAFLREVGGYGYKDIAYQRSFTDAEAKKMTEEMLAKEIPFDWFEKVHAEVIARFEGKNSVHFTTEANLIKVVAVVAEKQSSLEPLRAAMDLLMGTKVLADQEITSFWDVGRVLEYPVPLEQFAEARAYVKTLENSKEPPYFFGLDTVRTAINLCRSGKTLAEAKPLFEYLLRVKDQKGAFPDNLDRGRFVRRVLKNHPGFDLAAFKESVAALLKLKDADGYDTYNIYDTLREALALQGIVLADEPESAI